MDPDEIKNASVEELYERIQTIERKDRKRGERRQVNHAIESEKNDINTQMINRKQNRLEFDKSRGRDIELSSPIPSSVIERVDCSVNLQNHR